MDFAALHNPMMAPEAEDRLFKESGIATNVMVLAMAESAMTESEKFYYRMGFIHGVRYLSQLESHQPKIIRAEYEPGTEGDFVKSATVITKKD